MNFKNQNLVALYQDTKEKSLKRFPTPEALKQALEQEFSIEPGEQADSLFRAAWFSGQPWGLHDVVNEYGNLVRSFY